MDDKVQAYLGEFLEFVKTQAGDATAFAKEQAPLVVQEYLRWEFWSSAGLAVLFLVLGVFSLLTARWFSRMASARHAKAIAAPDYATNSYVGEWAAAAVAVPIVLSVGAAGSIVGGGITNAFDAAKVCIAPRVVVLEKVSTWLHK